MHFSVNPLGVEVDLATWAIERAAVGAGWADEEITGSGSGCPPLAISSAPLGAMTPHSLSELTPRAR